MFTDRYTLKRWRKIVQKQFQLVNYLFITNYWKFFVCFRSFLQLKQTQGNLEKCDTDDPSAMKTDSEVSFFYFVFRQPGYSNKVIARDVSWISGGVLALQEGNVLYIIASRGDWACFTRAKAMLKRVQHNMYHGQIYEHNVSNPR